MCGKQCAKKLCVRHSTSRVFDLLFDIMSHTHSRRIIYVFVHITAMRHVLTHTHTFVPLRFFALSAYLRRSHLAASLPLALSLSLQHLLSYIELT